MAPNGLAREAHMPLPQGHAPRLPELRHPPTLPSPSQDLRTLMRTLAQEYREFVGKGDEEEEAWSFLAAKLGGDRAVAREVGEALHRAGLGGKGYSPEEHRNQLFPRFLEALRLFL
ncbi:hypothetical protein [Thermus caldilimi]|uniref:hypothetical protein n=1 Tax=Thermus caldilimi TaxID=2483360 RepID=UPI00198152DB|nr:hypothetical protein [Thermus caldilimi]